MGATSKHRKMETGLRTTSTDLDLSRFSRPKIAGDRGPIVKSLWYLTSAVAFQHAFALLPYAAKAAILRFFGAKIGSSVVIKPRVTIKNPWFLTIGENSWIGEMVWIDNPGWVEIGRNVCISQGCYIVTGNHDYGDPAFGYFSQPIEIADRCWICAKAVVPPGAILPEGTVVPIGSVWRAKPEGVP